MRAPEFWSGGGGGLAPILLSPISAIYAAATARRMVRPGWHASVPVICCGTPPPAGRARPRSRWISAGGGNRGIGAQFLMRGYGGRLKGPVRVDPAQHDSTAVGDEALLLAAERRPGWPPTAPPARRPRSPPGRRPS